MALREFSIFIFFDTCYYVVYQLPADSDQNKVAIKSGQILWSIECRVFHQKNTRRNFHILYTCYDKQKHKLYLQWAQCYQYS